MRKGCQISKNSEGREWIQRATWLQNFLPFKEKDCGSRAFTHCTKMRRIAMGRAEGRTAAVPEVRTSNYRGLFSDIEK